MKKFNKESLFLIIFTLITIHPLVELDYLCGAFFDSINLPRISTVIDYIIFPLFVFLVFILFENNKKSVFTFSIIYLIILGVYFYFHSLVGFDMQENARMGYTAFYSIVDEIEYMIIMYLPLVYVYVFNKTIIKINAVRIITSLMSAFVSLPIVISNFLGIGRNTYGDRVAGNLFDWFSKPFNSGDNHPRRYATKFFFEEGNTIGILLLMLLPFMYYFFYKAENKKQKFLYFLLILTDSLAMLILGTRVATYGTLIIPIVMIIVQIFTIIIKTEKLNKLFLVICVLFSIISSVIIPVSPAYQNQLYDAADYTVLQNDDFYRVTYAKDIKYAEGFEPFSEEWINYYSYMFENYKFLIGVTPSIYYTFYYDYRYDPKFWVDVIFNYKLEERVNARQIEQIFTKYKWNGFMKPIQHLTGTTYSLFMRGGINIEQDFIQQFYSFGYLGFPLVMGPWIVIFVILILKMILGDIKQNWNMLNIMLFFVIGLGTVGAITSGHVYDELTTSMILLLCVILLFQNLKEKKHV